MGLVVRQSILTTIISYAGVVIGYINLLYLYPRFLAPEQVGLLRTVQDAAILFTPFAQFGITQSILRYLPFFTKDKQQSGAFITLMLLLSLSGFALFFIVFTVFKGSIAAYFEINAHEFIDYISLTAWLTLILLMLSVLEAYSRSLLRTVIPNLIREVIARLLLAVLIAFYYLGWLSFDQFILATLGSYLICLLLLAAYLGANGDLHFSLEVSTLRGGPAPRDMIRYSLLGFTGSAALIIIGKTDSLMVAGMMGLAANAVYTTAFYMATVIEIPKRALSQVAMPLISRAFEKNDIGEIRALYQKTAINQFIIGALLLVGVVANLSNLFALMPKSEIYETGRYVVIIIGVGRLADMLFGPSSEIIILSKYYWFNMILIVMLAALMIVLNNALIPRYGIEGAAWSAAVSLVLFNFVKFIFIWAKLGLHPFSTAFLKVILIGGTTWGVHLVIPSLGPVVMDMIVRSAAMTLVFGALVFWAKVSPEANELAVKLLRLGK